MDLPRLFLGFLLPSSAAALTLFLTACSGRVEVGRAQGDGGGAGESEGTGQDAGAGSPAYPGDAAPYFDGSFQLDASGPWDGSIQNPADHATGPAPACSQPAVACGALFPGETPFATSQDAANALVGQWLFCDDSGAGFYPPGQLGEEYTTDGTYYQLIAGPSGAPTRNLDPQDIGTWQVGLDPRGGIQIFTFGGNVQNAGGLSACPASLTTLGLEAKIQ